MVTTAEAQANPLENLGRDIMYTFDYDVAISSSDDFSLIKFRDNLKQAIITRLQTARGELVLHPLYGSRLHQLLGTPALDEQLILAKMHTKEALLQEPRIREITKIDTSFQDSTGQVMNIEIDIKHIFSNQPLNLVYALFIPQT